jgi:hypothetical protein
VKVRDKRAETANHIGVFTELRDLLDSDNTQGLNMNYSEEMLVERFTKITRIIRELICTLNSNGMIDQAILLELIWKVTVKSVDNGTKVQKAHKDLFMEAEKQYLRKKSRKHHKEIDRLELNLLEE